MQRIRVSFLALTITLVALIPHAPAHAVRARLSVSVYAPGEIIIKLKEQASATTSALHGDQLLPAARSIGEQGGRVIVESIEPIVSVTADRRVNDIISRRGLDRVFLLKLDPGADVERITSDLRADEAIEYAEPNYRIVPGAIIPEDPSFKDQWGLRNLGLGVEGFPATLSADIKAPEAWAVTTGSPDVIVAVTDTGIDITHPDLDGNIYTNAREIPANGVDDDLNGFIDDVHGFNTAEQNGDVSDIVGHGTQMAGIIAAEMDNGVGISGVSQSKILPVRFFKRTGSFPEDFDATVADAARALLYSIAAGASVINASWRTLLAPGDVPADHALALKDAVSATNDAGVLLVGIAGNDGHNNDFSKVYPGAYQLPNQITVAASDYNDEIWHTFYYFYPIQSGFGKNSVDLAAPGVSVLTTVARGDCVLCTNSDDPEQWYARADGTSASAAFVSGVAALVKTLYPDDYATLIRRRILEGVDVTDSLLPYVRTSGRLSAIGALRAEVNVVAPALARVKYKAGSGKLFLYGSGIQRNAVAVVGNTAYSTKVKNDDLSNVIATVPKSALPKGVPIVIRLRNPDGGSSQSLTFTR